ncbi:Oligopeptide transport system permease protein oppB [uncultured Eubacterium sp.]|nr:Oligopeptide transport system permease protein oppB [uncultured Eubacterium sp.]
MSNSWKEKSIYVIKKMLQMLIVLILLSVIVFVIARLCPGDPLKAYYGDGVEHMSEMQKEFARERLGLNDSMMKQYGSWVECLFEGDLGLSYKYKQPVSDVIGGVWVNTLILGGFSYILTFVLSALLGMFCSLREDTLIDRIICKIGVISGSIPAFFLALLLILIFAVNLKLLPTSGAYSYGNGGDFFDRLYHLILPVTVMVLEHLWYYAYMVRNKLVEETREDYVLLCKSEGIPRRKILYRHCLRNIMPSMLVIMAISVPHILGGTYVVETVFSYPGLGTLSFEAAMYQDYNMLMALCLLTGFVVLVFNLLAQIINEFIDPRMKYEKNLQEVA